MRLRAIWLTAVLLLTGCVAVAPSPTDQIKSGVEFQDQVISWASCESDYECATVAVPLDHLNPADQIIEIALIRKAGTENLSPLLINPGGPGASGFDYVRDSYETLGTDQLRSNFQLVGFDPRGVGRSAPVTCTDEKVKDQVYYEESGFPLGSDDDFAFSKDVLERFAASCQETGFDVAYFNTQQSATGFRVDQASCNGATHSCGYANVTGGTSYNDVLPSLNLVTDLGNDNVLRFGMGRVLARPNMEDMKATRDFSLDTTTGTPMLKGSGGNPNLQPFRADTIDLSWEKYFGKKGYFSVAGYYKDLKTYILKRSQVFDFANYITPGTVLPSGGSTMGLLTQASNGSGGSISGVEMALNVPFSMATSALDGFGVVVNTSLNNSSVSLPASGFSTSGVNTTNIPLPGLSKQVTNLRLYYEKSGLQMSVAARKRSDFLGSIADYQDNTQLVYIKGETQVDAQASYEFTQGQAKGLTLMVQGINLTNAEFAQYDAKTGNTTDRKKFGPSMMFGASYKF